MEIKYYQTLPSTSSEAAMRAKEGAAHLYTVVAEQQSAGRGRLQRSFFSPKGGLYFSTVLRTELPLERYGVITPLAALAVRSAIGRVCGISVEIKWVNDLLYQGKKVCGILAESGRDENGAPYVILGIGINTCQVDFPTELAEIAGVVPCPDKNALLREILAELSALDERAANDDWLAAYRAGCCVLQKEVLVIKGEMQKIALATDVLPSGALRVAYRDGTQEDLHGAEISLRLTQSKKN